MPSALGIAGVNSLELLLFHGLIFNAARLVRGYWLHQERGSALAQLGNALWLAVLPLPDRSYRLELAKVQITPATVATVRPERSLMAFAADFMPSCSPRVYVVGTATLACQPVFASTFQRVCCQTLRDNLKESGHWL
jgi:hypothetical protein